MGLFFVPDLSSKIITLDEDTSKHIVGVLRMQKGQSILITDGKGKKAVANIIDDNRKKCSVEIISEELQAEQKRKITIGISLIKNVSRFEWFLEKATEIGVSEIIPLLCDRTEKEKFRHDRMHNILISAMLQSQQSRLPLLHQPTEFEKVLELPFEKKFIAHCEETHKQSLHSFITDHSSLILIGPEGDFTSKEINLALHHQFVPVSLGETRLRTETAGMVAAVLLKSILAA